MNRPLIIGFLLISTLHAQAQQPEAAKLKTDAQKIVADPDSKDVQDVLSMFDELDSICSH